MDTEPKTESSEALRKSCRHLMVDLDLDNRKRGAYSLLAKALSKRIARNINVNVLAMALSGYRNTKYNRALLLELHDMLSEMLSGAIRPAGETFANGDIIHGEDGISMKKAG